MFKLFSKKMFKSKVIYFIIVIFMCVVLLLHNVNAHTSKGNQILSRKRRYIAFPEGSSLSAAICTTIGAIGNPEVDYMSYALNWGVAYDLPNETWVIQAAHGFKSKPIESKPVMQRRFRRDLYRKIEIAIDSMGYNGRDCILRALCESSNYFFERTGNMIEELLKTILSFPKGNVLKREYRDIHNYNRAYMEGSQITMDCSLRYSKCGFSLLELTLGKYSMFSSSPTSKSFK